MFRTVIKGGPVWTERRNGRILNRSKNHERAVNVEGLLLTI